MVCGLCHREPQDHTESTSGPTRCDYKTHRENCPGGYRTGCEEHSANLEKDDMKAAENKEDIAVDKLTADLSSLNLSPSQDPQGVINQLKLLLQQGGAQHPSQLHGGPPHGSHPEGQNYSEILQSLSNLFNTPNHSASSKPQDVPKHGEASQARPDPSVAPPTPKTSGLDQLASKHIADNQPFLEKQQNETSYTGPTINTIRQDKPTQDRVSQVIDALKYISPVFGQPSTPGSQVLPGISPLDQLKQQLTGSIGQPSPAYVPPVPPQQPLDLLHQLTDLLSQQANQSHHQQPTQALYGGHYPGPQQPLYVPQASYAQQPLPGQPQLLPQQPTLQSQLSQLLANLQGGSVPANPPQPPPALSAQQLPAQHVQMSAPFQMSAPVQMSAPLQQMTFAQLQQMSVPQLLQHPELLQQLAKSTTQQKPTQPSQSSQLHNLQGMTQARAILVRPTEYSRFCQVDYSEKVKADNANLVMYCYGFIRQILLARHGHVANMSDSEINGRLQHLLHLLELTAMFSSNSDYSSFAWHRARNYSSRIFNDLDNGNTTWASIGSKLDPTSMMQAIEAVPREFKKREEKKKGEDAATTPPCPKWNSCDVPGKCSYEVDNPGKTCNRPHICSHCFTKFGHTKTNHKESSCRKKDDSDSNSGSANQPTK